GITPRMLSKELKHLEENQLVRRSIADADFRKVEYTLTPHGQTLKPVIVALRDWGLYHRATIMQKNH
ncbi:MAG: winged helix-turn-helix transcriptional regulator, partial [Saprospiraceae bacterium]